MKKTTLAPSLLMAGLLAAGLYSGGASADPYASWKGYSASDDDQLTIRDSFNDQSRYTSSVTEDNDVTKSLDYSSVRRSHEDNDVTTTVTEDNDLTADFDYSSVYRTSEDNDVTKSWSKTEDNDITKHWTNTEDNDYTHSEDNDTDVDVDFQIATPTITSTKDQDQAAGHVASGSAYGVASGHDVGVQGGDTMISAGNDDQRFYGPAMVNTNTNQVPVNNLTIGGSNMAPIGQSNTFAGRDMGPKGVFAPVGNTSAVVGGDVSQQSGVAFDQAGDALNSIQDPISSGISR